MKIELSVGEIVDKLSILSIKIIKIEIPEKRNNIQKEYDYLQKIVCDELKVENKDFQELVEINVKLWEIEDEIRKKESNKEFDNEFIDIARKVYKYNDYRHQLKVRINIKYKSNFIEEKSYHRY